MSNGLSYAFNVSSLLDLPAFNAKFSDAKDPQGRTPSLCCTACPDLRRALLLLKDNRQGRIRLFCCAVYIPYDCMIHNSSLINRDMLCTEGVEFIDQLLQQIRGGFSIGSPVKLSEKAGNGDDNSATCYIGHAGCFLRFARYY